MDVHAAEQAARERAPDVAPAAPVLAEQAGAQTIALTPAVVLALQRTAGNASVTRMLASQPDTPAARVERMIADADDRAIQAVTEEELAATTPSQRAGMVRVLVDLTWTDSEAEAAVVRLVAFSGQHAQVAERLDALGYRKAVLAAVDSPSLSARLRELLGESGAQAGGSLGEALTSGDPKQVMAIADFSTATPAQRLGLLRILLEMRSSSPAEEAKILDIVASAGNGLRPLMDELKATGLKQALFDHIDAAANKQRLVELLAPLKDAELNEDLAVFQQGFLEGVGHTVVDGLASAAENFSIGALIQGMLHPILHPVDTLNGLLEQVLEVVKTRSVDLAVATLRDITGSLAVWLAALALIATGLTAALGATVVLIPGAAPIGVIAASLWADSAAMGVAFIAFAIAKLVLDLAQGGMATTARERAREAEQVGEDATLLAVIALFGRIARVLKKFLGRFRKSATNAEAADPKKLAETAEEAKTAEAQAARDAEAMKSKAGDKPAGAPDIVPPQGADGAAPPPPKAKGATKWTVDPNAWKESAPDRLKRIRELEKTDPTRAREELEALERDLDEINKRNVDPTVDAEVDAAFERLQAPRLRGKKKPRVGDGKGKAVPTSKRAMLDAEHIRRLDGESVTDAVARVHEVIYHLVAKTPLKGAWEAAVKRVLKGRSIDQLTDAEMIEAYKAAQRVFWDEVRADPSAAQWLESHGFDTSSNAAKLRVDVPLPEEQIRVSLDHVIEKAADPRKALDGENLRLEFHDPNSTREVIQMRHPELRPGAN